MNSKIINKARYKKVSKLDIKRRKKNINKNIMRNIINIEDEFLYTNDVKINNNEDFKVKKIYNFDEYKFIISVICKVSLCFFIVLLISCIFAIFLNKNNNIVTVFNSNQEKLSIDINYDLKVGIKDLDFDNNVCLNELNKYSKGKLLTINDKYEIKYEIIENIEQITNTAYSIKLKDSKYIDLVVNELKKYSNLNIKNIEKLDDSNISIILKVGNPYFIYYLSKININIDDPKYFVSDFKYIRNNKVDNKILESINIINYENSESLVSDFLNKKIDLFLTSSEDELRSLSSYGFNFSKYRDGETYFMFFNVNNEIFKIKDIRKVISCSLNKKKIIKELNSNFYETIDIPYLYSDSIIMFNKIGSENIIINNSYIKKNGIYYKNNIPLVFKLIVNKNDNIKCKIADNIKFMLEDIGIRINIVKCNDEEMKNNLINGNYDLVLATVNLNEIPDISFLYKYLNINGILDNEIKEANVNKLKDKIRNEFLCVGIAAKTTYLLSQKNIYGFSDISYNNLFYKINSIGVVRQNGKN